MNKFLAIFFILGLTSCGTVSDMKHHPDTKAENFAAYDTVIIGKLENASNGKLDEVEMQSINMRFSKKLKEKIENLNLFRVVKIGDSKEKAIRISGTVTDYDNGNLMARMMIGFGAGAARFDANVVFIDSLTNKRLADIDINLNSWLLGGAIAGSQDGEQLINMASNSIADNLKLTKLN